MYRHITIMILILFPSAAGRVRALRGTRSARGAGAALRAYALHLAQDKSTTFAQNVDNFISCTLDSKEICPQVCINKLLNGGTNQKANRFIPINR